MTFEIVEMFRQALLHTEGTLAGVRENQWDDATPCSEWSVRSLVNHIVYETLWAPDLLAGKTIAEVGDQYEGDVLGDDPVQAYEHAAKLAEEAVASPGALSATCHLSYGDTSGEKYITQLLHDVVIHGWDLAKATGQSTEIPNDLLDAAWEIYVSQRDEVAGSGLFAAPISVAEDADKQTKLLAGLGRVA